MNNGYLWQSPDDRDTGHYIGFTSAGYKQTSMPFKKTYTLEELNTLDALCTCWLCMESKK